MSTCISGIWGDFRDSSGFFGILLDSPGFLGDFSGFSGFFGIFRDFSGLFGFFGILGDFGSAISPDFGVLLQKLKKNSLIMNLITFI